MTVNPNLHMLPEYTTWPKRLYVRAGRIEDRQATRLVVSTIPFGQTTLGGKEQQPNIPVEVGEAFLDRVRPALGAWLVLHADGARVMDAAAFGTSHALERDPRGGPFL